MRYSLRASFLLIAALFLAGGAQAQIHGVPASVTSLGFGGSFSPTPGVAASVTSLGPLGFQFTPPIFGGNCCFNRGVFPMPANNGIIPNNGQFFRHAGHFRNFGPLWFPAYSVPYTQVVVVTPEALAGDYGDYGNYEASPAMYVRRGPMGDRVRAQEPEQELAPPPAQVVKVPEPAPVTAQPSTLLVFKDGHQLEVLNYAIVDGTLFDLGDGRARKIQLADLDLSATQKANDDRGVDFRLPVEGGQ